jgi:hypothetical protein
VPRINIRRVRILGLSVNLERNNVQTMNRSKESSKTDKELPEKMIMILVAIIIIIPLMECVFRKYYVQNTFISNFAFSPYKNPNKDRLQ